MKKFIFIGKNHVALLCAVFLLLVLGLYVITQPISEHLQELYASQQSVIITDRHGEYIAIQPNAKGYYARAVETVPAQWKTLILKKEDRFFAYHPGINPFSILRDTLQYVFTKELRGSSTISQQLVKILLGNENQRTLLNKITETLYAISLELHANKKKILTMYTNSVYLGNQAQGIGEASWYYFRKSPEALSNHDMLQFVAALNNPSRNFPGAQGNKKRVKYLASLYGTPQLKDSESTFTIPTSTANQNLHKSKTLFELETLGVACSTDCKVTLDAQLTETLRDMLRRNLATAQFDTVENGAIVVIKLPENEVLSIVGSPNPNSKKPGSQINMAIKPRPIGSTAKPFIYMKAFEKGARPYSLVEDREYKYEIGTGFAFYPKNYDGQYRGEVTLHEALSNSLNVPSVKVLEYAGLQEFSHFLSDSLDFVPIQPLENYELGIALGALEMDLLTLSGYFTIFPNEGVLKPLTVFSSDSTPYLPLPMQHRLLEERRVADRAFIQLVNKILSDRDTSVEQFGIKSDLNLAQQNYALKTGTSRNFHDSWTVGYTPDFLVGVWIGNSDNTPMKQVSGQLGAGKIWHEAMDIMLASPYNKKTPFSFDTLENFSQSGSVEYGLPGDDYDLARDLLKSSFFIKNPHHGDTFLYEPNIRIPLVAQDSVQWFIDDKFLGENDTLSWRPSKPGQYMITAKSNTDQQASITVFVRGEEYVIQ